MNVQLHGYSGRGEVLAIDTFNFPSSYPQYTNLLGLKFLYNNHRILRSSAHISREMLDQRLLDWFLEVANGSEVSLLQDLADMIQMYSPKYAEIAIEVLRARNSAVRQVQIEDTCTVESRNDKVNLPRNHVYNDRQSVHDTTINKSVKRAVVSLCQDFHTLGVPYDNLSGPIDSIQSYLIRNHGEWINDVIIRIRSDNADFGINVYLYQVFIAVWAFIEHNPNRDDMEERLIDEMKEMRNMCASGHLSRLVNALQGYTDKYVIRISDKEQIRAVVSSYLTKKLKEAPESVHDDMFVMGNEYIEYVKHVVMEKIPEWYEQYGEVDKFSAAVSEFAGTHISIVYPEDMKDWEKS